MFAEEISGARAREGWKVPSYYPETRTKTVNKTGNLEKLKP